MSPARLRLLRERAVLATSSGRPGREAEAARHCEALGLTVRGGRPAPRGGDRSRRLSPTTRRSPICVRARRGRPSRQGATIAEVIGDLETLEGRYDNARARLCDGGRARAGPSARGGRAQVGPQLELRSGDWGAADRHLELRSPRDSANPLQGHGPASSRAQARDCRTHRRSADRSRPAAAQPSRPRRSPTTRGADAVAAQHRRTYFPQPGGVQEAANLFRRASAAPSSPAIPRLARPLSTISASSLPNQANPNAASTSSRHRSSCFTRIGDRHRQAAVHSNLADALHALGRRNEAVEHLSNYAAALFADVGGPASGWSLRDLVSHRLVTLDISASGQALTS